MPDTSTSISRNTAEWLLLAFVLLLLGGFLASLAHDERLSILATEKDRLTTLSRIVNQQVIRHIESSDRALVAVRDRYPELIRQKNGREQVVDLLHTLADAMSGVRVMMVLDATGRVQASTLPQMMGRDFGGRDYFRRAQALPDPETLFISEPFRNSQGIWSALLIRVIPAPGGGFGGIVFGSIEPREFADMLDAVRYARDMWAGIAHVEGRMFVLSPGGADLSKMNVRADPDSLINRHLASGQEFTLQQGIARIFGTEAMVAIRNIKSSKLKLDGYLIVGIARDSREMLASWRYNIAVKASLFALLAMLSTLMLFLVHRRRRLWERHVADEEMRFREIFDASNDAIFIHEATTGQILDINQRMLDMYELTREQALSAQAGGLSLNRPPFDEAAAAEKLRKAQVEGPQTFEWHARSGNGRLFWVEVSLRQARIGRQVRIIAAVRDISDRKRTETELRIAAAAFESSEGMMVTDANGVVLRINRAFTEISGFAPEDIVGKTPRLLQSGRHDQAFYETMWAAIRETGSWQGEIWDKHKSGHVYPKWLTITAVYDEGGEITHYVGSHYDITERKLSEEKINALAFYDQLTGLPNRTLLLDRIDRAMAAGARNGTHGALLFIDLDNFKTLNDTQGHETGDLLLKEVAARLRQCIRDEDTAARQGGDEFVVVLAGLGALEHDAARATEIVAEKILAMLGRRYDLGRVSHRCSASIGATLFRGHQVTRDELMKQADLAMYKSKASGRNMVRFFDPAMEAVVRQRADLEVDLRRAIDERQFLLHYQPQVMSDGRIVGAEVLIRWRHPQRGMVSPAEFIPLAEDTELILPIGEWVLQTACERLATWGAQAGMDGLGIAVNVSARQFHQRDFVDRVLAALRRSGASPRRLKIELTESLLVADVEKIIDKMNALKAHGIGFSLDDFGTGYSSLSYLRRLPLDQLKIDQSFVRDVLSDPNDAVIARTVVALGQSLGLVVIAEGVETEAQREFLASSGCHAYQGYLFGKPMPVEEFEAFVGRW